MEFIWRLGAFLSQFAVGIVSYAITTIIHGYSIAITFAGSLAASCSNKLFREPANVNA